MEFELQPVLTGDLIEARPLRVSDFHDLFRAASDPLIWEQHPDRLRYTPAGFKKFFDGAIESRGALAVIERSSGTMIGSSRYWNLKPDLEVEIGWTFLERRFWGGAFNRELKSLMTGHALRFVDRVIFIAGENNVRSQRALQKIGARFVETLDRIGSDGTMQRNVVFEIRR